MSGAAPPLRRAAARPRSPSPAGAAFPASRRRSALLSVLAVFAVAVVTGLGGTWLAISAGAGFETLKVGPWVSHPRNGAIDADPYARAVIVRTGEIPLGLGEGLAFTAGRDSAGQPLVSSCSYRVFGRVPPTRFWTLAAHEVDGSLMPNPADRWSFTSGEVVRDSSGRVAVEVSHEVRPGNWLPVGSDRRFQLTLRLYDTPVSGAAAALEAQAMPRIDRVSCP